MKPPDVTLTGRVEAIAKGGSGIVFHENKPVFIAGVIPGEEVMFTITGQKRAVLFGSLQSIIQPSPQRTTPACPYYGICGGCNFQHIDYAHQVALKKEILLNNLERIAKIPYREPIEAVTSPPYRYRTRTILKVSSGAVGFYKRESHDIVEIETCPVLPVGMEQALAGLRRHRVVGNVSKGDLYLLANGGEVAALIAGDHRQQYVTEREEVRFQLKDFTYTCTPVDFIQANRFTLEAMLEAVQENLEKDGSTYGHAVDLFCGAGFFTIPLARRAGLVTAVEISLDNIESLKQNLAGAGINNVHIEKADALQLSLPAADIFVVDPPRSGLSRKLIQDIKRCSPRKVLYFSCDSASFSRDIFYFREAGYRLAALKLIDNFPQTDHFEIFSVLERI